MALFRKRKKEDNFFDLLTKQSELLAKGMHLLHEYCLTGDEKVADAVIKTEDEGDMVRRILVDEINKSFITPFDREDLFKLSSKLDEILDYAKTSVDEIRLFKVKADTEMTDITAALSEMADHIILAVSNMEHHEAISSDEAIYVKAMENKVGDLTVKALTKLFDEADFRSIFKYREIYRHLNQTADIGDEAMDCLLKILVKMS
ncbi:MAG TPA: DUF47 family protein [Candidatus Stercoripulliclostridium merdigallinarum]|uniref:DUF47 family protein n=1 Tax=Candidatus Stercoripulliclostridium merdigallinarum TaxID=2840951 RepID=A0A9D1MI24_9FIRM|nr:DUF47 family protein [Candidatus Stercoripulliclostridium merdigallinarum]